MHEVGEDDGNYYEGTNDEETERNEGFHPGGELLIVVGIISVLVAISIPIFTNQLEKAREATDAANIRSQYAQVMTDADTETGAIDGKATYGPIALKQRQNTSLKRNLEGVFGEIEGAPSSDGTAWVSYDSAKGYAILYYDGSGGSSKKTKMPGNLLHTGKKNRKTRWRSG